MEKVDRKPCAGKLATVAYIHPFIRRNISGRERKICETRTLSDLSVVLNFNKNCIVTWKMLEGKVKMKRDESVEFVISLLLMEIGNSFHCS